VGGWLSKVMVDATNAGLTNSGIPSFEVLTDLAHLPD